MHIATHLDTYTAYTHKHISHTQKKMRWKLIEEDNGHLWPLCVSMHTHMGTHITHVHVRESRRLVETDLDGCYLLFVFPFQLLSNSPPFTSYPKPERSEAKCSYSFLQN